MSTEIKISSASSGVAWNKGRLVGQKRPLRPKEVCAIRIRLQIRQTKRDLAMFNLAIDSKLRGCDLVSLRVDDIALGGHVRDRATIVQQKTGRPVQFEITEQTRVSLQDWLNVRPTDRGPHVPGCTAPPTARIRCAERRRSTLRPAISEQSSGFSNIRRLRARVRYLGIEVDDALSLSEQIEL